MSRPKLERLSNGASIHKVNVKILDHIKCPCGEIIDAKDVSIGGGPTNETETSICPKCGEIYVWNSGGFVYAKDVYLEKNGY